MVAKFVNLNKPWSCKYGKIKTNKKATTRTLTHKKNDFTVHHYTQEQNSSPHFPCIRSLRKQTFRLVHRRWGTFREEERLRLSDRNSILMTYINVYIINPVVMGFKMQICSILRFSWSILVKCCVHLQMSSRKTQMPLLEKTIYSANIDCFVRDSI